MIFVCVLFVDEEIIVVMGGVANWFEHIFLDLFWMNFI